MNRCSLYRHGLRFRPAWLCCCLIASIWLAATHASARTILIDDFNDGNDDGWTYIDSNIGHPWGPGVYDAASGAYNLSTTDIVPGNAPGRGFMLSLWDESTAPSFSDGYVRARLKVDTHEGVGAILFRFSGDIASGLNGYAFVGVGGRGFVFNRIVNTSVARRVHIDGLGLAVGEEWWMEGGAVGDDFSMKVWRVGEPEPDAPQISFTDAAFSNGWLAVDASMNFGSDIPGMVNTTFDDVHFRTPPITGDLNDDGYLTGDDFLAWQRGESPRPFSPRDLGEWQSNFGAVQSPPATHAVPEPPTILLTCAIALANRRRGKFGSRPQCTHGGQSQ